MSRALVQWRVVRKLMADVLTPEQRRKNMQHIKSNNTKIEVLLRKALWRKGYRYRKNYKGLPGMRTIFGPEVRIGGGLSCLFRPI